MKKLLVGLALIFTLSAVIGWGNVVRACPYDDPADPRNAECAPATTGVVNVSTPVAPTSTLPVAPASTDPESSPSGITIVEGDVPGRSRLCPEGQYRQTYEPFAPCGPERCIDTDGDGIGTTMWHLDECRTTPAPGVGQQLLPATGSALLQVLVIATGVIAVGGLILSALRYWFVVRPGRRRG